MNTRLRYPVTRAAVRNAMAARCEAQKQTQRPSSPRLSPHCHCASDQLNTMFPVPLRSRLSRFGLICVGLGIQFDMMIYVRNKVNLVASCHAPEHCCAPQMADIG